MASMSRNLWLALLLLIIGLGSQSASAADVDLRHTACTALADNATNAAVVAADYRCGSKAPTDSEAWLWLRLEASRLRELPPGWRLLVDQARFDEIAVLVVSDGVMVRRTASASAMHGDGAIGGLLKFKVEPSGRGIDGLYLGYRRIDDLSLMRKIVAKPATPMDGSDATWLLLMGVFAGTLL